MIFYLFKTGKVVERLGYENFVELISRTHERNQHFRSRESG